MKNNIYRIQKQLFFAVAAAALLSGCTGPAKGESAAAAETARFPAEASTAFTEEAETETPAGASAAASHTETVSREDALLSDTYDLTRVTFTAEAAGTSIYIVGGIHGNETAGWKAANTLAEDLADGTRKLARGKVSVTAPVNAWGAAHDKRTTYANVDINRSFPGDPAGNDGEQIAAALFDDIRAQQPDLVLDLHEALLHTDGSDSLGDSIICGRDTGIEELVLGLLTASDQDPDFPKLNVFGSPPAGSINRTAGDILHLPVITVETRREDGLEQRIYSQLRVIEYILAWYGM